MMRTLFAAMSGVAFGLVLGVSGYHLYTHTSCHQARTPQVVRVEKPLAPPCAMAAPAAVVSPPSANVQEVAPQNPADVDAQADQNLAQAKSLASKEPAKARQLCRKTMQLYSNNPSNPRVRAAFKLLNTIKTSMDDDVEY